MSNMPRFRAYTEMVDDEKLRLLAFEDRWHYVALLCLKGQGVIASELRNVVGLCAERYTEMASIADRYRGALSGLQDYVVELRK